MRRRESWPPNRGQVAKVDRELRRMNRNDVGAIEAHHPAAFCAGTTLCSAPIMAEPPCPGPEKDDAHRSELFLTSIVCFFPRHCPYSPAGAHKLSAIIRQSPPRLFHINLVTAEPCVSKRFGVGISSADSEQGDRHRNNDLPSATRVFPLQCSPHSVELALSR